MKLASLVLLTLLAGFGIAADAGLGLGVAPSSDATTIVSTGAIPALTDYGPVDTQAHIRAALDAFFADPVANRVSIPAITITENYSRELTDGQHKQLFLSPDTVLKVNGTDTSYGSSSSTLFDFYTTPLWISTVTAITRTTGVDLVDDSGDAATSNTVDVLTLGTSHTISKHDILKLVSDDLQSNRASGNCYLGEFVVAGKSSSGTTLTLTAPIREYRDTYSTTKRIGKMPNASVQIYGGRGTYDTSLASSTAGPLAFMRLWGMRNAKVVGFKVNESISMGILLLGCYNTEITECSFSNQRNAPGIDEYGYGINDEAGEATRVSNCHFHAVRHGYTTNSRQFQTTASTGRDFWRYGRTRNANISGNTALACSNAPFDCHNECDGLLYSANISHGTYDGASSAGGSIQMRGDNITIIGGHGEGSYGGAIMRTGKNGRLIGYTSLTCRTPAFISGNGDTGSPIDAEVAAVDCRFGVLDVNQPVVNITAASGKANKTEINGGVLMLTTTSALAVQSIITVNNANTDLYLGDVLIDLTNCAAGTTLAGIISVTDTQKVRGKIRIKNTANCTLASIIRLRSGATANADVDLDVIYESTGSNGITNCTAALPHGVTTSTFSATKLRVSIITTGGTDITTKATTLTSSVVNSAATLNLKGNGEPEAVYRLQPAAELSGGTNAIQLTASEVPLGYRRTFVNDSAFLLQFRTGLIYSLPPGASVTVQGTGSSLVTTQGRLPSTWFNAVAPNLNTAAASSGTGETTVATIAMPGGEGITTGSRIRVYTRWTGTGTAGTKTARVKIGSTALLARGETTNISHGMRVTEIWVRSNASWFTSPSGSSSDFVGSTGAAVTGVDDLTSAFSIVLTAQATAGDVLTLEGYAVEVINP